VGRDNDAKSPHSLFLASPTALRSEGEEMISNGASHQGPCQQNMLRKEH